MNITTCPGCGATGGENIGSCEAFSTTVQDETFVQPPFDVKRCAQCGLFYKTATLDGESLGRYYSKVNYKKWEIPGLYPTEVAMQKVLRQLPAGAKILDFGCSSGRLLAGLVKDYRCFGLEPNQPAAREAAAKGIQIVESTDGLQFDAMVLSDVFEHLTEPTTVLAGLKDTLSPGGLMILSTGNGDALTVRWAAATHWYYRNVEHVVMLSRRYAEWFANQTEMQLTQWTELSHYDSPLRERFRQTLELEAFMAFHGPYRAWAPLLRVLPKFRNARRWTYPPQIYAAVDHAIAVFRRGNLTQA